VKLPENLRDQLKIPLGKLILEEQTSKENILREIPQDSFIITVGDATTEKMMNFGIMPSLQIVDGQEKRVTREPLSTSKIQTNLTCENPAAQITSQAIEVIQKALDSPSPVRILVDGEEDLLVLPVCLYAPDNAIVMYGQPNEGLVVVHINTEIRNKTKSLLDLMD
jgi:uncharacterized protein (UPF0218 family)